jgi:fructokinase
LFPDGPRLGGAAANVAFHAARLGNRALLVSRVGNDELGTRALQQLTAAGVDTRCVQVDNEAKTGTVGVELTNGEPRFTIGERVAWDRIALTPALEQALGDVDVFCFSTLAQRTELGAGPLREALAHSSAIKLCDLNLRPPFVSRDVIERSVRAATVVKLNDSEADRLRQLMQTTDAVQWLHDQGVETVALTFGSRGAELRTRSDRWFHPGVALVSSDGDAVGAGDAFVAVLAHHLARGTGAQEMLPRANQYAAAVASVRGAMVEVPGATLRAARGG